MRSELDLDDGLFRLESFVNQRRSVSAVCSHLSIARTSNFTCQTILCFISLSLSLCTGSKYRPRLENKFNARPLTRKQDSLYLPAPRESSDSPRGSRRRMIITLRSEGA